MKNFVLAIAFASVGFCQTGVFQSTNPHYPARNPFYFEGKVDYEKLAIDRPGNSWEFMQRGIHKQDDLEDLLGAMADYRESVRLNDLNAGTCQTGGQFDPPPCMFTARLRLGYLLLQDKPEEAISLFQEVLRIDPQRLEVNELIGEAYEKLQQHAQAIAAFEAEIALSPITPRMIALTGDEANNAHAHWALAEIHEKLGDAAGAISELQLYLKATKWHSDVYPWRIPLARKRIERLSANVNP